jgi:polysaccharide export outer membrane protein
MVIKIKLFGVLLSMLVLLGAQNTWGEEYIEEYIIGTDDILNVTFWQQPDLNSRVKVRKDGVINLPIIGEVKAGGLSQKKLSLSILEKISLYNVNISQVSVTVEEYNHRKIYVQGEVRSPGAFGFETIPDLWGAIREAGGPTGFADLSSVSIIRGDQESKVLIVDLETKLKASSLKGLPKLKPKDTIWIPRSSLFTTSGQPPPASLKKGKLYSIWGEVRSPGVYPLETQIDLVEAISFAGGPTPLADLEKIKVLRKGNPEGLLQIVDLEDSVEKGNPSPFLILSDDTIIIPEKKPGPFSKMWRFTREIIPLAGAIASVYLLVRWEEN